MRYEADLRKLDVDALSLTRDASEIPDQPAWIAQRDNLLGQLDVNADFADAFALDESSW